MEAATTWQTIKMLCEAYLEAERAGAVQEVERIVRGECNA